MSDECDLSGYAGRVLRVDLTHEQIDEEQLAEDITREFLGGTGLGARFLYDGVAPTTRWSDAENLLTFFAGPLAGTPVPGTGTYSVVSKGPMTNLAAASQANGFFGAYLKFSGFDGIVVQGIADEWKYLYIHDGIAELRDASHLLGQDTFHTEDSIRGELGNLPVSIATIGPAGENLVRFAAIVSDKGHVAGHNGVGAVMGSKRLKAIVASRPDKRGFSYRDTQRLRALVRELREIAKRKAYGGSLHKWGTAWGLSILAAAGQLPVKNYTTNLFPEHPQLSGQYLRKHFELQRKPCWACPVNHVHWTKVTQGPYSGYEGEEPEYECIAAWGPQIGQTDLGAAVMLSDVTDRLGLEVNEAGWVIGWVMECYERGLVRVEDTDGLEMTWGNAEATSGLLNKIARREGFGDVLAEGVMRASERIGEGASECAIFVRKGATPRGHDHRALWKEMLDTCVSNTGTIEVQPLFPDDLIQFGFSGEFDPFCVEDVVRMNAQLSGRNPFIDSLGVCRFCATQILPVIEALNEITGWSLTMDDALVIGKRILNLLRVFNFRHGLNPALEIPSPRYGSTPVDGPVEGIGVARHFTEMRRRYWRSMGWDDETGRPLPETLERLRLGPLSSDL